MSCAFHPGCLLSVGNCERIGEERSDDAAGWLTCLQSRIFRREEDMDVVVGIWEEPLFVFWCCSSSFLLFPIALLL
jgi:hypothetical protein